MRVARLCLSPEMLLLTLARGRYEVLTNGMPPGVGLHGVSIEQTSYDATHHQIVLVLQHEAFVDVPEGALLPTLEPVRIRRLEEGEDHAGA